jgi:hypothetical protein
VLGVWGKWKVTAKGYGTSNGGDENVLNWLQWKMDNLMNILKATELQTLK